MTLLVSQNTVVAPRAALQPPGLAGRRTRPGRLGTRVTRPLRGQALVRGVGQHLAIMAVDGLRAPRWVNQTAQVTCGATGAVCAHASFVWLRDTMRGAAYEAARSGTSAAAPNSAAAQLLLPLTLSACLLWTSARGAWSLGAAPLSRQAALVGLATALTLTYALRGELPFEGLTALLLGTATTVACLRQLEAWADSTRGRRRFAGPANNSSPPPRLVITSSEDEFELV